MRVLVACIRGGFGPRDKHGRCRCDACEAFNRERHRKNNAARAEYRREWRLANPERCAAYYRKWRIANKDQRRAIEKSWRERNPDAVRTMSAKAGAKWSRENRGARNAITRRRSAAIRQRLPAWADLPAIQSVYEAAALATANTGIPHEVDHIYPLQGREVSGLHVHENLRVITRRENRAKKNLVRL